MPGLSADFGLADLQRMPAKTQTAKGWVCFGVPSLPGLTAKADLLMRCEVSQVREWQVSEQVSRMSESGTAEDRLLQKRQTVPM
jgi:hypothetical protein